MIDYRQMAALTPSSEPVRAPSAPDWYSPTAPPLSESEAEAAARETVRRYPYRAVIRDNTDPPIPGQTYGGAAFMLFDEPKELSNGATVYGFLKLRACGPSDTYVEGELKRIVREVDSRSKNRILPVGSWVPITDDDSFCKEVLDVRMDEDEVHLRDDAVRDKKARDEKVKRQIREREEEVKKGDLYDDPLSLKFYTMKRVTELRLTEAITHTKKKLEEHYKTRERVWRDLRKLERENEEWAARWVSCYNEERAVGGIPPFRPRSGQFEEYEDFHPDDLSDCNVDEMRGYHLGE